MWTKYRLPSKAILKDKVNETWNITKKPTKELFKPALRKPEKHTKQK